MYKAFYSLSATPFQKDIAVTGFFASHSFSESLARLDYLKSTRGIGVLVGEPGAGKTSALRCFATKLNPALFKVIYFPLSTGTVMDFYRGLAYGVGEAPCFRKVDLFRQIQKAIVDLSHEKKVLPIFILDEMQLATNKFLDDLSILFNFSMDSENPFVLILAGLPHFMDKLTYTHNQPLSQRVVMRFKMGALSKDEVKQYVSHHMEMAGARHEVFSDAAIEALASHSRGFPRLINNLAINALLYGCSHKLASIDEECVLKATQEASI